MSRSDIFAFLPDQLTLAPGTVTEVAAKKGQNALNIKIVAGSGTLCIGGATGSTGAYSGIGMTFGLGYPVSSNEIVVGNVMGSAYLWCSGATLTVAVLGGRTPGDY